MITGEHDVKHELNSGNGTKIYVFVYVVIQINAGAKCPIVLDIYVLHLRDLQKLLPDIIMRFPKFKFSFMAQT